MIGGRRPISGRKPGDKRVRVERYHAPYFRYTGPNQLTAKAAASAPTTPMGRFVWRTKAILIGKPLANEEEIGERLSKKKALAIFSSDAISSSAYATEEILLAFLLAGVGGAAFLYSIQVSIGIAVLLGIVAFSYRQVCIAYPTGGGSYSVSKANIGKLASLIAASALLIDYTLTVAVSTSSAVEQIASAFPALDPVKVEIGITAIALITLGNLRGLREAGNIFAIPTYLFLGSAFLMIGLGTFRILFQGDTGPAPTPQVMAAMQDTASGLTILILLRAFASGAVALTGTEAIATGVPAFQPPEARNAARTLMVDGPDPRHPVHRDHVPRLELPHPPDRGAEADRHLPDLAPRLRRHDRVLPVPGVHGAAAVPRGEHELQRVPAPRRRPRRGRLRPPPVRVPRRPARVLAGDHPAGPHRRVTSSSSAAARPTR